MKFESFLAGANFRPREARDLVRSLKVNDTLLLMRDKGNEYDQNAIKVMAPDPQYLEGSNIKAERYHTHIGFIERAVAAKLAPFMDAEEVVGLSGYTCTVIEGGVGPLKPLLEIVPAPLSPKV